MMLSKNAQKIYDSQLFIASDNYSVGEEDIPTINEETAKTLGLSEDEMTEAVRELVEVFEYAKYGDRGKKTFYKLW